MTKQSVCKYCQRPIVWMNGEGPRGYPRFVPVVPSSIPEGTDTDRKLYNSADFRRHSCKNRPKRKLKRKLLPAINTRTLTGKI